MLETPVARHRSSDEVDVVLSIAAVGPLVVYWLIYGMFACRSQADEHLSSKRSGLARRRHRRRRRRDASETSSVARQIASRRSFDGRADSVYTTP